jgi:hypothetical protein
MESKKEKIRIIRKAPRPSFQRLVQDDKLSLMHRAADLAGGKDEVRKTQNRQIIDRLVAETGELDLLLTYARAFRDGDSLARDRFAAILDQVVRRDVRGRQGGGSSTTPKGGKETEMVPLMRPISGSHESILDCLVQSGAVGDIFFTVLDLCDLSPTLCRDYVAALDVLFVRVSTLEVLYAAAKDVFFAANPRNVEAFSTTIYLVDAWSRREIVAENEHFHLSFGNPSPFPTGVLAPRGWTGDCGFSKMAATRDAFMCFNALRNESRYHIDDIINLTHSEGGEPASRRGCIGDLIEIQGRNFGYMMTSVVFAGGVRAIDYPLRESDRIRCRVPIGARNGDITVIIPVIAPECTRFDVRRLQTRESDNSFEVMNAAVIEVFSVNGTNRSSRGENRFSLEACHPTNLELRVCDAERATVTDETDTVLWDSGSGAARTIEANIDLEDRPATHIYTLQVESFCNKLTRTLEVEMYQSLFITSDLLNDAIVTVKSGESLSLELFMSCVAPAGGVEVRLTSTNPEVLMVPPTVEMNAGEESLSFSATTVADSCDRVYIHAEADGYRTAMQEVLVYRHPCIRRIEPESIRGCRSGSDVTIHGDYFAPQAYHDDLEVLAIAAETDVHETRTLTLITTRGESDEYFDNEVDVRAEDLPPGLWDVEVRSFGLRSNRCRLEATGYDPAEIVSFEASPDSIRYSEGGGTTIRLDWRVRKARFVRVVSDVRGVVVPMRHYSNACVMERSDGADLTLNETHKFTLEAYTGVRGDSPKTRTVRVNARGEPSDTPEPAVGFRAVRILNCHVEERSVVIYLLDLTDGTLESKGELSAHYDDRGSCAGESMVVDIPDGHVCQIVAYDPGNPYCTPPDPTTPGCQRLVSEAIIGDESGGYWDIMVS